MKKNIFLLCALIILLPKNAMAWGSKGHNLVAQVAFKYLDKPTKKVVLDYLDGMTIEEAANWMDDVKKDICLSVSTPKFRIFISKTTLL